MAIKSMAQDKRHCFPNAQIQYYFATKSCSQLNYYYDTTMLDLINNIGELGLSIFMLDDGNFHEKITKISASSKIYTHEECQAFINILYDKFNIKSYLYEHPSNGTKNYFRVPASEYSTIYEMILRNIKCDYTFHKLNNNAA